MAKSVPVYRIADTAPQFYVSTSDARHRVDDFGYLLLQPDDLTQGIRFPSPPKLTNYLELAAGGVFRAAWHIAPSQGFMVWQMRSGNNSCEL